MKLAAIAVAGLAAGAVLTAGPVRADNQVPPGTPIILQFQQDVSTKVAHKGDEIRLRVYTDVVVGGKTLIRQDAPATGIVENVRKPRSFGRRAELKIRLESVRDVSGRKVALEPYNSGDRFTAGGVGASGAGLLVLGPVGLVGGAFVKGNHITIAKGTRIQAEVWSGKAKKDLKKEGLPPVEPPDRN